MSDLVLPGIEPARVIPSGAPERIERQGASFKEATDAVSKLMYQVELADIEVQTQEADNALKKNLNETIDTIKSNPYVTPNDVEEMFKGSVPESVKLTDEAGNRRALIPMHEIARDLFERRANEAASSAAQGIKHEGWRAKFERESASAKVESARGEAYDWQRAQRMADLEIRSVSGYEQAMRARDYEGALRWLNGSGMSPTTREKLIAEHPTRKVEQNVLDLIRVADKPEDLDKVLTDLSLNSFDEGISLDEGTQARFAGAARERKHQIIAEQAAAAKAAYKAGLEVVGNKVEKAVALAEQSGRPAFTFYPAGELLADERAAGGFDESDTSAFFSHMRAAGGSGSGSGKAEPSEAGWRVYARFGELQQQKKLKDIPVTEMMAAKEILGNRWTEVFGWWRAAKDGEDDGKGPLVSPEVTGWMKNFFEGVLKRKPEKDDPDQYLADSGRAISAIRTWQKANPDQKLDPDNLRTLLSRTFEGAKTKNAATAVLNRELPRITGRAYVTPQDLEVADKAMKEQRPLVEEAWSGLIERDLNDGDRAQVYALTQNKATVAKLTEYLQAQTPPKPVNPRTLAWAAVKALQHPADSAYEQGQVAKAARESESRQIKAAGKEQAAVRAEVEAVDEAAARQAAAAVPKPAGPTAAPAVNAARASGKLPSFRESDQPKKSGPLFTETRVKGFVADALDQIGEVAYNSAPVASGVGSAWFSQDARLKRADAARTAAQPGLEAAVRAALPAWTAYQADYLAGKVPRMEFGEWFAKNQAVR